MKKMILMATGIAVLAAGTYFAASIFAQGAGGNQPAQPAASGTKIGVVNVGYVFNKWKRADDFKKELESAAKPYNDKAKALQEEMKKWDNEIRTNPQLKKAEVESRKEAIKANQRKLEDLADQMRKQLGNRSEENLVTLWKECNVCVTKVSEAYGFALVLGYGDPLDKGLMDLFPNINRKMNAMDAGGAVPLYVHGSCDLSNAVAATLNQWYEHQQKQLKLTPTSGTK